MGDDIEQDGFLLVSGVLDDVERRGLLDALGAVAGAGRRGVLRVPEVGAVAWSGRLIGLVRPHLAGVPIAVRAIYFDKTPESNWLVAWHQDLTLAVRRRVEVTGFGPWSTKGGITHVQAPVELLEEMLAVRLHLDDADASNGALRVLPGTHRFGRLSAEQTQGWRARQAEWVCEARAGDALLMRPLLLHASGRSNSPRHRRVLHIEYAGFRLPGGLEWHEGEG